MFKQFEIYIKLTYKQLNIFDSMLTNIIFDYSEFLLTPLPLIKAY